MFLPNNRSALPHVLDKPVNVLALVMLVLVEVVVVVVEVKAEMVIMEVSSACADWESEKPERAPSPARPASAPIISEKQSSPNWRDWRAADENWRRLSLARRY